MSNSIPWIEKYRPKTIKDMRQNKNLINLINNIVKKKEITHLLFYGPPGTGKTSAILAIGREIFGDHYNERVIEFNASNDRGIAAVRDKITNVAKRHACEIIKEDGTVIPHFKIIILDEADAMTDEAQDALRVIIEQYSSVTIFCFICNYISKMTDAIKSRCTQVYFKKLDDDCMMSRLKEIAIKESMLLTDEIHNLIIEISNGDMRRAIMLLQNIKYHYEFKNNLQPLVKIDIDKLKHFYVKQTDKQISTEITKEDVYEISAYVPIEKATEIINNIVKCKNIKEVHLICKNILATGYPMDIILIQLGRAIIVNENFDQYSRAKIINYSGEILYRLKERANETIQLMNYMSCIYGVYNDISVYDIVY